MATVHKITAKVLIQVDEEEPVQIGTVEIPINLNTGSPSGISYPPGVRGVDSASFVRPRVVQPVGTEASPPK